MTYATGRTYLDADSHIMELPDFLTANADPGIRDRLPPIDFDAGARSADSWEEAASTGAHPPSVVDELVSLGDGLIAGPKGYHALGAFNSAERTSALDMLGFDQQFVFATFSSGVAFDIGSDLDVRYGAATAHNRGMAEFCAADARLIGVATVPLDDTDLALAELERRSCMGSASFSRRPFAWTRGPRPVLGQGGRGWRSCGAARRRRAVADSE
jgi:hypothetical protein